MARDPRHTYAHLCAIANDPKAPASERATAKRLARQLADRYGPEATAPAEEDAELEVVFGSPLERDLALRVATFLGVIPYKVGREKKPGNPRSTVWLQRVCYRGPASLVQLAGALYADHRIRQARVLRWAAIGYQEGAFPLPPSEYTAPDEDDDPPSDDDLAAALAGRDVGRRNRANHARKQLTG